MMKPYTAPSARRASRRNDALMRLAGPGPVAAPLALRVIGRRGAFLRHAALQSLAVAVGATPDMSRVPSAPRQDDAARTSATALQERESSVIILEN